MMNARICAIIVLFEIFVSLRSRMINYLDIKFVKKGGEWYVQPQYIDLTTKDMGEFVQEVGDVTTDITT